MAQTELDQQMANHPSIDLEARREKLIRFYDELSEITALNSFIYDAFLSLFHEQFEGPETGTTQGLALTCRWLNDRQHQLKETIRDLME